MSEPLPIFAEPDAPKVTERHMLDLLAGRYGAVSMGARRFAYAEHVARSTTWTGRIADAIAIDCHGRVGPRGCNQVHGHEVKVSRSDWLAELRDPSKAEAFRPYVHRWWLVVSDRKIVAPGELPNGWGLLAKSGGVLRCVTPAPLLTPEPMPNEMIATLMRATAKTARASS